MKKRPLFSVCIPNFNYSNYIRETIASVLAQDESSLEIVVADNASTDDSCAVVNSFDDKRIRLIRNAVNVGFAANIDRATETAMGTYMLVLSSDDIMRPGALSVYRDTFYALGADAARTVLTSAVDIIDSTGKQGSVHLRAAGQLFYSEVAASEVPPDHNDIGLQLVPGSEALKRSLLEKNTPAMFLATCYARPTWEAVCGYRSGYRMWPDSHFLNKVLSLPGQQLGYVPQRLFGYRIHNQNQTSQEMTKNLGRGALKYQMDAYLHTLEFPQPALDAIGLTRADLVDVFVGKAVVERGLQALEQGSPLRAARLLAFAFATYPEETLREKKALALASMLGLGPAGPLLAKAAGAAYRRWRRGR
jgi:glycosyltransferase involved in cell wall biosynthesis